MSRRKQKSEMKDFVNMITAVALIVIAVLLLIFVYFYIRENGLFGGLFSEKEETEAAVTTEESGESATLGESGTSGVSPLKDGLNYLDTGELIYVLSDREAREYDAERQLEYDEDVTILKSSWYDDGGDGLYYFGDDGTAVSEYSERAMVYSFDDNYKLDQISFDARYRGDGSDEGTYPGAVRTKALIAYIDETKTFGDYYAVMYKKTTDSLTHELGGGASPQYTSRYALSIAGGYIYYLALGGSAPADDDGESGDDGKGIENKLYRMRPGADYREIVAEEVRGYKVYEDLNGDVTVYYDDGARVRKASDIHKDEDMLIFSEDAGYYVDISSGRAVLMLEGGHPVTRRDDAFKAGNFVYTLSEEGEILNVQGKPEVSTGGYVYLTQSGESFGVKKSRVLRRDTAGAYEVISAEFDGSVGDLHMDFDTGSIIAEYFDNAGYAGLIKISLDGDVDYLEDCAGIGSEISLIAIQSGKAVVQTDDTEEPYKEIRISASYPLAAGIDPFPVDQSGQGEQPSAEQQTEEYDQSVEGESAPMVSPGPGGPGDSSQGAGTLPQGPGSQVPGPETQSQGPGGAVIGTGPGPGGN